MSRPVFSPALVGVALLLVGACGGGDSPGQTEETPVLGKIALVSERDGNVEIYVIKADGTGLTNLTNHPADDGGGGFHLQQPNFTWSPDGKRIAFISDRDGNPEIYLMNADGTGQSRLTVSPDALESDLHWSPDGMRIAFVSTVDEPKKYSQTVHVIRTDGSGLSRIEVESGRDSEHPSWFPDGSRIAFDADDIYVAHADGSQLANLTGADEIGEGNENYFAPGWSPDGSRIAFDVYREASNGSLYQQLYIMRSDGSGLVHVPDGANEDDYYSSPSWSPDGKRIVFFSDEGPGANIHVMNADGSNDRRITDSGALLGVWSPHGDVIAMLGLDLAPGGDEVTAGLYLINPDGSGKRKVTTELGETYFAWSPVP